MLLFGGNNIHRDVESINDTDWHGNQTPFALGVPGFNKRTGGADQSQSMQDTPCFRGMDGGFGGMGETSSLP